MVDSTAIEPGTFLKNHIPSILVAITAFILLLIGWRIVIWIHGKWEASKETQRRLKASEETVAQLKEALKKCEDQKLAFEKQVDKQFLLKTISGLLAAFFTAMAGVITSNTGTEYVKSHSVNSRQCEKTVEELRTANISIGKLNQEQAMCSGNQLKCEEALKKLKENYHNEPKINRKRDY